MRRVRGLRGVTGVTGVTRVTRVTGQKEEKKEKQKRRKRRGRRRRRRNSCTGDGTGPIEDSTIGPCGPKKDLKRKETHYSQNLLMTRNLLLLLHK